MCFCTCPGRRRTDGFINDAEFVSSDDGVLLVKPVRESLILVGAGPEIKSYAGAMSAMAFLFVLPIYGKVADKLNRLRLINGVTAFFASNLLVFYALGRFNVSLGLVFFLSVGLFNLMLVAQFWAFTNDIYTQEQGRRLFAIIGLGSSLGAIFGAEIADTCLSRWDRIE